MISPLEQGQDFEKQAGDWLRPRLTPLQQESLPKYLAPLTNIIKEKAKFIFSQLCEGVRQDAEKPFSNHYFSTEYYDLTKEIAALIQSRLHATSKINPAFSLQLNYGGGEVLGEKECCIGDSYLRYTEQVYKICFSVKWNLETLPLFGVGGKKYHTATPTLSPILHIWNNRDKDPECATIVCGELEMKVHLFILKTFCEYFRTSAHNAMIESRTNRYEEKELDPETCKEAIYFMYHGTVSSTRSFEQLQEFEKLADRWICPVLTTWCIDRFYEWVEAHPIDKGNFRRHLDVALQYEKEEHQIDCLHYLEDTKNFEILGKPSQEELRICIDLSRAQKLDSLRLYLLDLKDMQEASAQKP